jgi:hypothetical protein
MSFGTIISSQAIFAQMLSNAIVASLAIFAQCDPK